ncbi:uncharacterized protein M6B38_361855 [Iris pallida]|uniref:Uncharacterized protein n=1 Tax=Iris pallida TaxID=29817 RepID=A0AAX6GIZ4_IRIPA|nr:uncharacterized protein M6B38_406115 [Iris pallida]KAJ6828664.1 uncharacterized protein M6B38_361855 [Iris pallida]
MGDSGGPRPEPAEGTLPVPSDPEGPQLEGAAADVRGEAGKEGGGQDHLHLRRGGALPPQHRGPRRHGRACALAPPQGPPPPSQQHLTMHHPNSFSVERTWSLAF